MIFPYPWVKISCFHPLLYLPSSPFSHGVYVILEPHRKVKGEMPIIEKKFNYLQESIILFYLRRTARRQIARSHLQSTNQYEESTRRS